MTIAKNDADPDVHFLISHELGMQNFREQLPVVYRKSDKPTYRTHRIKSELQIWLAEGRDFRSPMICRMVRINHLGKRTTGMAEREFIGK
ncbi:MAG: hypothetical protein U5K79_21230 [Cyclobacteriaceae bacterium]|nr:hypothetical protein [Cyclobacteriaceae bacterium]